MWADGYFVSAVGPYVAICCGARCRPDQIFATALDTVGLFFLTAMRTLPARVRCMQIIPDTAGNWTHILVTVTKLPTAVSSVLYYFFGILSLFLK